MKAACPKKSAAHVSVQLEVVQLPALACWAGWRTAGRAETSAGTALLRASLRNAEGQQCCTETLSLL